MMSVVKAALLASVNGLRKLHSMEQSRTMTLSRGFVMLGAGRVYWYLLRPQLLPQSSDSNRNWSPLFCYAASVF